MKQIINMSTIQSYHKGPGMTPGIGFLIKQCMFIEKDLTKLLKFLHEFHALHSSHLGCLLIFV